MKTGKKARRWRGQIRGREEAPLFLTDKNRLVFVTKALWREQYDIDHHIHLRNLRNVRVDKRAFHTERLRIEYEPLDAIDASEDSSTKRTVVMYDFKNTSVQEWVSRIKELYYIM